MQVIPKPMDSHSDGHSEERDRYSRRSESRGSYYGSSPWYQSDSVRQSLWSPSPERKHWNNKRRSEERREEGRAKCQVSSIWECSICLSTYTDRRNLLKHLADSGHSRSLKELAKKNIANHGERCRSLSKDVADATIAPSSYQYGQRGVKRKQRATVCKMCGESFESHKLLEQHITHTGHRWSYKKAREISLQNEQLADQTAHVSRVDDEYFNLKSLPSHNTFETPDDGFTIQSPDKTVVQNHCEPVSPDVLPSPEADSQRGLAVIPVESRSLSINLRDPRQRSHLPAARVERAATSKPAAKWKPSGLPRGLVEGTPWKLTAIHASPVKRGPPALPRDLSSAVDDATDSPRCPTPLIDEVRSDRPRGPRSRWGISVAGSPKLSNGGSTQIGLVKSWPSLLETTDTDVPINDEAPLLKPLAQVIINQPPQREYAFDKDVNGDELEMKMSLIFGENEGGESSDDSSSSCPAMEPETISVSKSVDCCQNCYVPFNLGLISFNLKTGDVTASCVECGARTIMENAYLLNH